MEPTTTTVTQTGAVAGGVVTGGALFDYLNDCITAHHLVALNHTQELLIIGALAPIVHAIGKGVAAWFTKKTGIITVQPQEQSHA